VVVSRYAFAPASVVAPLGTTALIANCFIAPLMLHERFRKKDIVGIGFSIVGAVTIVLSSKSSNKSVRTSILLSEIALA
jgi:drug/metabolite transporter (DMT)-like permease